jgi:hypothetical protein
VDETLRNGPPFFDVKAVHEYVLSQSCLASEGEPPAPCQVFEVCVAFADGILYGHFSTADE